MREFSKTAVPGHIAGETFLAKAGRVLRRCWVAYMDWRLQQLAINRLRHMSDRELQDIGVLRSQIEIKVRGGAARLPMPDWRLF